jgi:hypothetical protein
VLLFAAYALAVWCVCFRWRRQWRSLLALAAGVLVVVTLAVLDRRMHEWTGQRSAKFSMFQFLLWVEAAIITLIGGFICALPRRHAFVPCRKCGYELAGHEVENPRCPECGLVDAILAPTKSAKNTTSG